jgi:hypothetical protein
MKLFKLLFLLIFINIKLTAQIKNDNTNALNIVNLSIEAMGGLEYLKSIKTLYTNTKTEMEGRQVHWIVKEMLPNKGSFQIEYNNRIIYQNWFNGKKGFEIVNGEKKKADKNDFKDKLYKKNIFNELDYLDSTLWKLEYLGIEILNKDSCHKIKATLASGLVMKLYFDKNNHHMVRSDKIENGENNRFSTYLYTNFKKFDKLVYYTEMEFGEEGKFKKGIFVDLLINQNVDEKDFK